MRRTEPRLGVQTTRHGAWLLYAPDGWGSYPAPTHRIWLPRRVAFGLLRWSTRPRLRRWWYQ